MPEILDKNTNLQSAKKNYYAYLLDNIGPLPKELTLLLPTKVFYAIWEEFYHYLSLVAETAAPNGGAKFINYVESNWQMKELVNLSDITSYLVSSKISDYPDQDSLKYWLNISSLLEYGALYNNLAPREKVFSERFEYLQELDHFSEIMDLSLLTKHVSKEFENIDKEFIKNNQEIFLKYLNLNQDEAKIYKPIAGRSKYVNLGLERMLGEAAAKRRNCQFIQYQNAGAYSQDYYPIQSSSQVEAQFKVLDASSVVSIRTNYPYIALLLTSNSHEALAQDVILTEDSLLIDRIGQGILYHIAQQKANDNHKVIFEGKRAINLLYSDNTVVQLIDHMDKDGRLACITFDLAQIYYRQNPSLFEKIFKDEILTKFPGTLLEKLYVKHPNKSYHQIMYEEVYTHPDVKYRNELLQKIYKEIRKDVNSIEDTRQMAHYVTAIEEEIKKQEETKSKKVVSMYILEGSYDGQFDRYSKVYQTFAVPAIDAYRVSFVSEILRFGVMNIKS